MKKELVRNSISGVLQVILTALLVFVSVPVFISKLGMVQYGIFSAVSVIGNLSVFSNFGLNGALLVFLGKQGKCSQSNYDIAVTQIIMGIIVIFFTSIVIGFSEFLLTDMLKIEAKDIAISYSLMIYLLLANGLMLMGQSYTAILDSQFAIHITNLMQFIYSLIYWGGQILVLSLGGSLEQVGQVALVAALVWFIFIFTFARKKWGKIELSGLKTHFKSTARKQISYGSRIYASGLVGFLFVPLSKVLLAQYSGLELTGIFDIAIKIRENVASVINKALFPLQPYINREPIGKPLHERLRQLTSVIHLAAIAVSSLVLFTFPSFLELWLNNKYTTQIGIFATTITAIFVISSPTMQLVYMYLSAKGHPGKNIYFPLSAAVLNVLLFYALKPFLGESTIIYSSSIGMIASYVVGMQLGKRFIDTFSFFNLKYYLTLLVFSLIIILPVGCIFYYTERSLWDLILFPTLVILFAVIGIVTIEKISPNSVVGVNEWIRRLVGRLQHQTVNK